MRTSFNGSANPLELITRCPLCSARYEPVFAKMLKSSPDAHLWHVLCRQCSHAMMIVIQVGEQGVNSVGLITDLSSDDVMKLAMASPVTIEDCLSMHEYVHQHSLIE